MERFELDKDFLKDTISMLNKKYKDKSLSMVEKCQIETDLSFFQNMLNGYFTNGNDDYHLDEEDYEDVDFDLTIEDCCEELIEKCRDLYSSLGVRAINLIIKLYEDGVFYIPDFTDKKFLSLEEQAEYTIKNYEMHSPKLLVPARSIILPKDFSHIQRVDGLDASSYCYYSSTLRTPFLIVDPEDGECILNHEAEHACESILGIDNNPLFQEIGSIYFELLFSDLLMENKGNDYSIAFEDRVCEIANYIYRLYPLFLLTKDLHKKDFNISNDELIKLCEKYGLVDENTSFFEYVYDNVLCDSINIMINYTYSFLKAVELREKTILTGRDSLDLLVEEMSKPVTYRNCNDKVNIYRRYLSEAERKR